MAEEQATTDTVGNIPPVLNDLPIQNDPAQPELCYNPEQVMQEFGAQVGARVRTELCRLEKSAHDYTNEQRDDLLEKMGKIETKLDSIDKSTIEEVLPIVGDLVDLIKTVDASGDGTFVQDLQTLIENSRQALTVAAQASATSSAASAKVSELSEKLGQMQQQYGESLSTANNRITTLETSQQSQDKTIAEQGETIGGLSSDVSTLSENLNTLTGTVQNLKPGLSVDEVNRRICENNNRTARGAKLAAQAFADALMAPCPSDLQIPVDVVEAEAAPSAS